MSPQLSYDVIHELCDFIHEQLFLFICTASERNELHFQVAETPQANLPSTSSLSSSRKATQLKKKRTPSRQSSSPQPKHSLSLVVHLQLYHQAKYLHLLQLRGFAPFHTLFMHSLKAFKFFLTLPTNPSSASSVASSSGTTTTTKSSFPFMNQQDLKRSISFFTMDLIQWLHEHVPVFFQTFQRCLCKYIVLSESLDSKQLLAILLWLQEHGYDWDEGVCANVSAKGYLEILTELHARDCPWDASTCSFAALHNQRECLSFAREYGCPWNESTTANAAKAGNLALLTYLHVNNCPVSVSVY